ncbi:MAG: Mor transcription activator family protein [Pseudomonadota bacterium]|nr:Mor transcription activator family protein [Pseudomonadota bacterium]
MSAERHMPAAGPSQDGQALSGGSETRAAVQRGSYMSPAEAAVLDALLPTELTPDMRTVATCLYEALVLHDARAGCRAPVGDWLAQLQGWARQACMQLQHLAEQLGGRATYLAKGVAVHLSARDREMCGRFRGNNYRELAAAYGLTEMRVRQIVDAWQRERFARRQGRLDLDGED